MKNVSKTSKSTIAATEMSSATNNDDKLSPSKPFLACTDRSNSQGSAEAEEPDVCDSLAAAKDAIYPVAAACVILLTVLGICYSLYFTKAVMLPIVGAFLLNFLFSPVVLRMNRVGVPNVIGTFVVLGLAIGAIVIALAFAYQPATTWLAEKDQNLAIVKQKLSVLQEPMKAIKDVTEQIDEISSGRTVEEVVPPVGERDAKADSDAESKKDEDSDLKGEGILPAPSQQEQQSEVDSKSQSGVESKSSSGVDVEAVAFLDPVPTNPLVVSQQLVSSAEYIANRSGALQANESSLESDRSKSQGTINPQTESEPAAPKTTPAVIPVEVQQPSISNRIFSTTGDAFAGLSLMLVLLFYLLSAGDRGLEKLVKLMPTFRDKKRMVELSRAVERSISDYLFTTTAINFLLGLVIGIGMWAIGMPNPILWGVMAMFLNYFPFVGAIIGAAIVFLAAIVSFDSIAYSAWAPAIYLSANLVEANFITPILLGRSVSLHPVWLMIFFVIVAWVWGMGGAIIAVPVLAVIKISCDHIEPLMPVGEFLGR